MKSLVIEDDQETAAYFARGLREHGHVVDLAATGQDGLFLATGAGHDVLVVDRMLPGLDGLGLVRAMRETGVKAPVLFLTALGGVVLSRAFLARVDAISRTAEAIIEGDLARRVPVRGTGDDLDRLAGTLNRMLDRIGTCVACTAGKTVVPTASLPNACPLLPPATRCGAGCAANKLNCTGHGCTRLIPGGPCWSGALSASLTSLRGSRQQSYFAAASDTAWVHAPSGVLLMTGSLPPLISSCTVRS